MLDRAETAMNEDPGNAIAILDSIPDDGLSHSQRMRRLLLLTNAQNKCDTVFHSDSIQLLLVDYYDHHGSANDCMLAHYLLGRAHYDMGEISAALEDFQDAAYQADTTANDCDFRLLSRIHGQTARLFLEQEAPDNALDEIAKVDKYARLSNDTFMRLVNEGERVHAYKILGNVDSLININKRIHQKWKEYGNKAYAAMIQISTITYLLDYGDANNIGEMLSEYEHSSGIVDADGNLANGYGIYYYVKGRYYAEIGKIDSAFTFYHKALNTCSLLDERAVICHYIGRLYQTIGKVDSASSYLRKSYVMLDSAHIKMGTERLQRLKANNDYTYHKRIAEQKEKDSIRNRNTAFLLGLLLMLSLLAIYVIVLHVKRYKEQMRNRERLLQSRLAELEDGTVLRNITERETSLMESEIRLRFAKLLDEKNHPKPFYKDWKDLQSLIAEKAPQFYALISASNLTKDEIDICILIRLRFTPAQIHCFTGLTVSHISVIRKRLLQKVFHSTDGGAREFDRKLREL